MTHDDEQDAQPETNPNAAELAAGGSVGARSGDGAAGQSMDGSADRDVDSSGGGSAESQQASGCASRRAGAAAAAGAAKPSTFNEKWKGVAPRVSPEIFEGIQAVISSGRASRYQRSKVALIAVEMGYLAAAEWIMEDKSRYAAALHNGFTVPEEDGE